MFMIFTKTNRTSTMLVNLDQIRYVHINERSETELVFDNGFQLPVAETFDQVTDKVKGYRGQ